MSRLHQAPTMAGKILTGCAIAFLVLFASSWAIAGLTHLVTIAMAVNLVFCSFGAIVNFRHGAME